MVEYILSLSPGLLILSIIILFIGLVSQMALYAKAGKPSYAALVPVWNVMVFIEIVGRPKWHSIWIMGPGAIFVAVFAFFFTEIDGLFPVEVVNELGEYNWIPGPTTWDHMTIPLIISIAALIPMVVFIGVIFTEICDSFGKHKLSDKIYCIVFNGAYLLFVIGISQVEYEGPWWARKRGLPYYMPDFKHKGKKYLVTPEGPLTGDWKKQKLKVEIVDEKSDPIHNADVTQEADPAEETQATEKKGETDLVAEAQTDPIKEEAPKKVEKKVDKKKKPEIKNDSGSDKSWREEMLEKYNKNKS